MMVDDEDDYSTQLRSCEDSSSYTGVDKTFITLESCYLILVVTCYFLLPQYVECTKTHVAYYMINSIIKIQDVFFRKAQEGTLHRHTRTFTMIFTHTCLLLPTNQQEKRSIH